MKTKTAETTEKKNRPKWLSWATLHYLSTITVVSHLLVLLLSTQPQLFPGYDALSGIVGSFAEIIAGLYGTTLAGYTFFLSRIDGLMAGDSTLGYIVEGVKKRFKALIWLITFYVAVTLLFTCVLMYYPIESNLIPGFLYRLICNEFLLFIGFSVGLILYYSIEVINPNCLEKQAKKLKKKLCPLQEEKGNVLEFLTIYDEIEARGVGLLPEQLRIHLQESKGLPFDLILALLEQQGQLEGKLIQTMRRLYQYHSCVVNCKKLAVAQEMVELAKKTLEQLDQGGRIQPATTK